MRFYDSTRSRLSTVATSGRISRMAFCISRSLGLMGDKHHGNPSVALLALLLHGRDAHAMVGEGLRDAAEYTRLTLASIRV